MSTWKLSLNVVKTANAFAGGVAGVAGAAKTFRLFFAGDWEQGDHFTLTFTDAISGRSTNIGYGPATGTRPSYLKTFKRKLYSLADATLFFSALDDPTQLNATTTAGNGFIEMASEYGFADALVALAVYQGRLAVFSRRNIQVWSVDPDPANNAQTQSLENIGTVAGASVRGIGDQDVLFCADSGVRSLRVRDASNNAIITDLGTPVDKLVQEALDAEGAEGICSIVEPRSNRYWLCIGGTIFVFSYFPSSGVAAWSTYLPTLPESGALSYVATGNPSPPNYLLTFSGLIPGATYAWTPGAQAATQNLPQIDYATLTCGDDTIDGTLSGGKLGATEFVATASTATVEGNPHDLGTHAGIQFQTPTLTLVAHNFIPEKFVSLGGRIYVRSVAGRIYAYGGSTGAVYDATVAAFETPWLDGRSAATTKLTSGIDAGLEGGWSVQMGMDPVSGVRKEVYRDDKHSFNRGQMAVMLKGTHFKVRAESYGSGYARFSSFVMHTEKGDAK